jgi:DNA-binding response OmpR family regulator
MYILVISRETDCRKLWVDNLVIRGHLAVGVASLTEAKRLLHNVSPGLILVCQIPDLQEMTMEEIRGVDKLNSTPLVLLSAEAPDPQWMARWNIASHLPSPVDPRQLTVLLAPWLPRRVDEQIDN